jgi:PAS domain S-box-containing protein
MLKSKSKLIFFPPGLWLFAFLLLLFFRSAPIGAQSLPGPDILVLQSYSDDLDWTIGLNEGIKTGLGTFLPDAALHTEYLDTKRIADDRHFGNMAKTLAHKMAVRRPDVLITGDDDAFNFYLSYRDSLFAGIPAIFCGVNFWEPERLRGATNVSGVIETLDIRATLETALKLHPKTKSVFIVNDQTVTGQANKKLVTAFLPDFPPHLQVGFLEDLSLKDLLRALRELPADSLVLLLTFNRDRDGLNIPYDESIRLIRAVSPAPVYGCWSFFLGGGIVGGKLVDSRNHGQTAASLAARLWREKPAIFPPPMVQENRFMFDYQELKRFRIAHSQLPPGSIIVNQPVDAYSISRQALWTMILILLGAIILSSVLILNILRRIKAERTLRQSEERFRGLFENASDGVFSIDPAGNFTAANLMMERLFEVPLTDLLRTNIFNLFSGDSLSTCQKHLREILNNKTTSLFAIAHTLPNKSVKHIEVNSHPLIEAGTIVEVQGIIRDFTERKQRELIQQRAQRLELAGQIGGGVAHDSNNLLSVIVGHTHLLKMLFPKEAKIQKSAEEILQATQRIVSINDDLLALGRRGHFSPQPIRLDTWMRSLPGHLPPKIDRIELDMNPPDQEIWISGSTPQLLRVVVNLVSNAMEAIFERGKITITLQVVDSSVDDGFPGVPPGVPMARIQVIDTGCGIPAEMREKIFEPFFTRKSGVKKTSQGLGLAIVKGIITDHNGLITVDSKEGQGTTFSLLFPTIPAPAPEEERKELPRGREMILAIDDQDSQLKIIKEFLEGLGYTVKTAGNQEDALMLLQAFTPDLLIQDMKLAGDVSGLQVYLELRKRLPGVKVLILSGFAEDQEVRKLLELSHGSFLKKPANLPILAQTLRRELDKA